MKLKIKKWRGVAVWRWEVSLKEANCGICYAAFDACCPDCKTPGDDCPPAHGKCGHALHLHCIEKWLRADNSKELCPMCRQTWQHQ